MASSLMNKAHWDTGSSAVSSISDRNRHNPQERARKCWAVVWYYTHPY